MKAKYTIRVSRDGELIKALSTGDGEAVVVDRALDALMENEAGTRVQISGAGSSVTVCIADDEVLDVSGGVGQGTRGIISELRRHLGQDFVVDADGWRTFHHAFDEAMATTLQALRAFPLQTEVTVNDKYGTTGSAVQQPDGIVFGGGEEWFVNGLAQRLRPGRQIWRPTPEASPVVTGTIPRTPSRAAAENVL